MEAITQTGADGTERIVEYDTTVCETCLGSLGNGRVPSESLVRVDAGPVPSVKSDPTNSTCEPKQLEPLTAIEALIVSFWRPYRYVITLRQRHDGYLVNA